MPPSFTDGKALLEIRSDGTNTDIGLLLRRSDAVTGLDIWHDSSGGGQYGSYFDNRYEDSHWWWRSGTRSGGFTNAFELTNDGNGIFTGDVTAFSDTRLKENINTIDSALDKVVKMRGVTFNRTDNGRSGAGVLADELESIAPELVHDGKYKSVAYGNLTSYLIEAIKELKQEVEVLRATS